MGKQAYARTVTRKRNSSVELSTKADDKPVTISAARGRRFGLDSKIEMVTGDKFHFRNWYFPHSVDAFPFHPNMRCVDRYYPNAKIGPVCFDEPVTEQDIKECQEKARVLKNLGIKYAYVTHLMGEIDIASQLGVTHVVDDVN
jgi:hypothetical protein